MPVQNIHGLTELDTPAGGLPLRCPANTPTQRETGLTRGDEADPAVTFTTFLGENQGRMANLGKLFGQAKRAAQMGIGRVARPFRYEVGLAVVRLTNRPVTIFLSGREECGQTIGSGQNGADR